MSDYKQAFDIPANPSARKPNNHVASAEKALKNLQNEEKRRSVFSCLAMPMTPKKTCSKKTQPSSEFIDSAYNIIRNTTPPYSFETGAKLTGILLCPKHVQETRYFLAVLLEILALERSEEEKAFATMQAQYMALVRYNGSPDAVTRQAQSMALVLHKDSPDAVSRHLLNIFDDRPGPSRLASGQWTSQCIPRLEYKVSAETEEDSSPKASAGDQPQDLALEFSSVKWDLLFSKTFQCIATGGTGQRCQVDIDNALRERARAALEGYLLTSPPRDVLDQLVSDLLCFSHRRKDWIDAYHAEWDRFFFGPLRHLPSSVPESSSPPSGPATSTKPTLLGDSTPSISEYTKGNHLRRQSFNNLTKDCRFNGTHEMDNPWAQTPEKQSKAAFSSPLRDARLPPTNISKEAPRALRATGNSASSKPLAGKFRVEDTTRCFQDLKVSGPSPPDRSRCHDCAKDPTAHEELNYQAIFELKANIANLLKMPLEPLDAHVYVMQSQDLPGRVKVGMAKDVKARVAQIKRNCSLKNLVVLYNTAPIKHPARVEKLAHLELKPFLETRQCLHKGSVKTHNEWFHCEPHTAITAVKQWCRFMDQAPYSENGMLKDQWVNKLKLFGGFFSQHPARSFADVQERHKLWLESES
ncbi:uncharacterized protein K452DRAFT_323067 [Aplosporella prunicola CBS 121167]|uniref:Bacteriophage T5 Orf172 DNA-binding domain-containing protein n=1 Tax=Aplosporella prunicola CBS 121167 TaxID=1176127 RepID=A0A6A6AXA5_9PEZI|nr:uncharacterized protein K452DRAFT_323067 [Aplosporella prunicola CBS 121167]KAF2135417.1 hypothetical protein K452DRAFT_323067 [Aplosporella prunicola CBS 121167]